MGSTGVQRNDPSVIRFRILSGQTASAAINPRMALVAVALPTGFTGTTLTFQVSLDGTTFYPVYDSAGAALSYTVAASRLVTIAPSVSIGWQWIKLVAGSAQAANCDIDAVFVVAF